MSQDTRRSKADRGAPASGGTPGSATGGDRPLSGQEVADFLEGHPEFLAQHPELFKVLAPPVRWSDDRVVDIQRFMVETLKEELDGLRNCTQEVIETSRSNMTNQTRTHAAVLALLAAADIERLARIVCDDLPVLLDIDVATIGFEPGIITDGAELDIQPLAERAVDSLLGSGAEVALFEEMHDDGSVFGAGAGLVRSAALARLRAGPSMPEGLLALGSRAEGAFHPRQGTELLRFLARVVERCAEHLLLPPK